MDQNKNFFKTLLKALNPSAYDELSERRASEAVKYFFSYIFLAFMIIILINIPFMLGAPAYINKQLGKFDRLELTVDAEMNKPVSVTDRTPKLLIDTRYQEYNFSNFPEEKYIITDSYFYAKKPFSAFSKRPLEKQYEAFKMGTFKDVLKNSQWYSKLLIWMLILMMPSLLVIGYIYIALKYLLIILAAAFVGMILSRIFRFSITFPRLLKVGLYAITLPILLELIGMMFDFNQYYLHYLLFIAAFILGAIRAGDLEEIHPRRHRPKVGGKKRKMKDYVEIKTRD
ncbi:MAG: DUF1189 family protein [Candidatus Nanoarchaeia archaeon]